MFLGVILLISLAGITSGVNFIITCPEGFTVHNNKYCYYISAVQDDDIPNTAKWDDANEICLNMNGYLVKMDDRDENAYVAGKRNFWHPQLAIAHFGISKAII